MKTLKRKNGKWFVFENGTFTEFNTEAEAKEFMKDPEPYVDFLPEVEYEWTE